MGIGALIKSVVKRLATALFLALLVITNAACGQSMKQPDIKLNPHPKMRYELTLSVQDAPGPFESTMGYMEYETDKTCVPEQPISGHQSQVRFSIPFTFEQVDPTTYRGVVYLDMIQDEDYYGLGVCRWELMIVNVQLGAAGAIFNQGFQGAKIAAQQSGASYFLKRAYNDKSGDSGMPALDNTTRRRDEFFSTTLTAKEDFQ